MKLPRISQKHIPLVSTVVVYAILYAIGSLAYDGFFSLRVFVNFFTDNSFLGIVAVGMTFVILSGSIDLSVGSVLALSCILMAVLMDGPRMFHESDIRDLPGFVAKLKTPGEDRFARIRGARSFEDDVSWYFRHHLSITTRRLLDESPVAYTHKLRKTLAADIDRVIHKHDSGFPPWLPTVWNKDPAIAETIELPPSVTRSVRVKHLFLLRAFPDLLRDSGMKHPVLPIPLAILIVLALGTALGCGMGWVIRAFELPAFIVTLAGMFFARGLALIIRDQALSIKNPFYSWITDWGIDVGEARIPVTAMVFVAVVLVAVYISVWTRFGRNVYALGGNEEAALLMGLPVGRTKVLVHALSGFCAALAGVVFTLYGSGGNASAAVGMELDAIAAVVVGGTLLSGGVGYVFGTLVGVLIFGIIQTGISFQGTLSSWWTKVAIGVLLLFFILLQKLFARPGARSE